jgi:hypothetical protein
MEAERGIAGDCKVKVALPKWHQDASRVKSEIITKSQDLLVVYYVSQYV